MLDAVSMAGMNCLRLMNDTTAGTVLTHVHHFISVCKALFLLLVTSSVLMVKDSFVC